MSYISIKVFRRKKVPDTKYFINKTLQKIVKLKYSIFNTPTYTSAFDTLIVYDDNIRPEIEGKYYEFVK